VRDEECASLLGLDETSPQHLVEEFSDVTVYGNRVPRLVRAASLRCEFRDNLIDRSRPVAELEDRRRGIVQCEPALRIE